MSKYIFAKIKEIWVESFTSCSYIMITLFVCQWLIFYVIAGWLPNVWKYLFKGTIAMGLLWSFKPNIPRNLRARCDILTNHKWCLLWYWIVLLDWQEFIWINNKWSKQHVCRGRGTECQDLLWKLLCLSHCIFSLSLHGHALWKGLLTTVCNCKIFLIFQFSGFKENKSLHTGPKQFRLHPPWITSCWSNRAGFESCILSIFFLSCLLNF